MDPLARSNMPGHDDILRSDTIITKIPLYAHKMFLSNLDDIHV